MSAWLEQSPKIQVNNMSQMQNDEIDLFELFQTIWDGRRVIIGLIISAAFFGLSYSYVAQPKYMVSVPFTVNIYPAEYKMLCAISVPRTSRDTMSDCIQNEIANQLLALLGSGWKSNNGNISSTIRKPSQLSKYKSDFERASDELTNNTYADAVNKIAIIKNELHESGLGTEMIASVMLNSLEAIKHIDAGQSVVKFGSVSIKLISPRMPLILAFSIALGGILGVLYVLIANAMRNQRKG